MKKATIIYVVAFRGVLHKAFYSKFAAQQEASKYRNAVVKEIEII